MEIIIPRDGSPMGGVSSHIDALLQVLPKLFSFHYFVLSPTALHKKVGFFIKAGFNKTHARIFNTKFRINRLKHIINEITIKSENKAIFHSHDVVSGMAFLSSKHADNFPLIHTAHGPLSKEIRMDSEDAKLSDFIFKIEQKVYNKAKHIIAVDTGQSDILKNDFNIPEEKISIIRNAVDSERILSLANKGRSSYFPQNIFDPESKNFLVPRRLVLKNGVKIAIEAIRRLPKNYHLWIAGDGPLLSQYRNLVKDLKLQMQIHFLGSLNRNDVLGLMKLSDGVIIPSVPSNGVIEATSMAALEAMALGKPVIASNIGGLSEIIEDRINGLLFEPGNSEALVSKILNLESDEFRLGLCQTASKFVREKWSANRWGKAIERVYLSLV